MIGPICCGMLPTMPAKMMKLMPLPRPRSLISSPSHISRIVPAVKLSSRLIVSMLNRSVGRDDAVRAEQDADAVALGERERHGQHARVLVEAVAPVLALTAQLLERRDHPAHQLHDDAGVDVGVHPQADDRRGRQAASREDVQDPEQRVVREQVRQRLRVHVRDRNVRQRPEDREDPEREEELAPDVRRAEGGDDRVDQAVGSLSLASAAALDLARSPERPAPRRRRPSSAAAFARFPPARSARRRRRRRPARRGRSRRGGGRRACPRVAAAARRSARCPASESAATVEPAAPSLSSAERLKAWAWIVTPCGRVADAEDLDRPLRVVDQAVVREHIRGHERAALDLAEPCQVDRRVLDPSAVAEAVELRRADVERRLAALEPGRQIAAGTRLLALRAAARGLARGPSRGRGRRDATACATRGPGADRGASLGVSLRRAAPLAPASLTSIRKATRRSMPAHLGRVGDLDALVEPMQAERADRAARRGLVADRRADPGHLERVGFEAAS